MDSHTLLRASRVKGSQREAEISNLPWTQTDKDNALAKCGLGLRAWRIKKPMLVSPRSYR